MNEQPETGRETEKKENMTRWLLARGESVSLASQVTLLTTTNPRDSSNSSSPSSRLLHRPPSARR